MGASAGKLQETVLLDRNRLESYETAKQFEDRWWENLVLKAEGGCVTQKGIGRSLH